MDLFHFSQLNLKFNLVTFQEFKVVEINISSLWTKNLLCFMFSIKKKYVALLLKFEKM